MKEYAALLTIVHIGAPWTNGPTAKTACLQPPICPETMLRDYVCGFYADPSEMHLQAQEPELDM